MMPKTQTWRRTRRWQAQCDAALLIVELGTPAMPQGFCIYSSVGVGVVHVLCACARVQSRV